MLAFVEGSMERVFINSNFKYITVVPVSNGISWSLPALCGQIVGFFKLRNFYGEVIVWLDREGRAESAEEIGDAIRNSLIDAGADPQRIHLLVCDRMTENV